MGRTILYPWRDFHEWGRHDGGLLHASGAWPKRASARAAKPSRTTIHPYRRACAGANPGSFETAHSLRDGTFWSKAGKPIEIHEKYDLVVVGGGISGLAAAHFFRERVGTSARILILEIPRRLRGPRESEMNFIWTGGSHCSNGGTLEIDSPTPYSPEAGRTDPEARNRPAGF